jgi:glycerol-3-phosphate cytidylyltransferase
MYKRLGYQMYSIGYTTGTFDMLHTGHIALLNKMKNICDTVIIGLTTDTLAKTQKRSTIFSYDHRRAVLEQLRCVDRVIEHHGHTKQDDYKQIRFSVLCIGDDYMGSEEYESFSRDIPHVPVIYFPRTHGISTSDLINSMRPRVISMGTQCPLLSFTDEIIKYIPIRTMEYGKTGDVYAMPIERPRNWKRIGAVHVHENIPAVNAYREVEIFKLLRSFTWYPVREILTSPEYKDEPTHQELNEWKQTRANDPIRMVYELVQRNCGPNLKQWWPSATDDHKKEIVTRIHEIIDELRSIRVIHGDLHAGNICIDQNMKVSIIDFGWCTSDTFDMDTNEKEIHKNNIEHNFDLLHLNDSLAYDGIMY